MSEALLSALWRASWKSALVILVLWCLCRVLEKRLSANIRCWLWRGVYIKLLLGLVIAGGVALPILPAAETANLPQVTLSQVAAVGPEQGERSVMPLVRQAASAPRIPSTAIADYRQTALITVYLLGVSLCLFRVARAGLRTHCLLREAASSEDADAIADLKRLALQLGLRRRPRLMVSEAIEIPFYTAGAVLLPAAADYAPEERRLILTHELAHARRRDLVWEWLGTLTHILFFFHPLVLIARREERLARESAADALALRITEAPASLYGKLLLAISLARPDKTLAGAIGVIEHRSLLRRRLLILKESSYMPASPKSLVRAAVVASIVSIIVIVPWQVTTASRQWVSLTPTLSVFAFAPLKVKTTLNKPKTAAEKAKAAIESGDTKAATRYASEMLAKNTDTKDWNYGNILHGANQILGLAALQEGRTTDAKNYLIAAGSSPGSPQLDTFGPDMVLAQQLLDKGEKDAVIRYLDLTARFWAHDSGAKMARIEKRHPGYTASETRMNLATQKQINDWKRQIQAGQKPQLNMSGVLRTIGPSSIQK